MDSTVDFCDEILSEISSLDLQNGAEFRVDMGMTDEIDSFNEQNVFEEYDDEQELCRVVLGYSDADSNDDVNVDFDALSATMVPLVDGGGVKKCIRKHGSGPPLEQGRVVRIHYSLYHEWSEIPFDSTELRHAPLSIIIGSDESRLLPALMLGISSMRNYEEADFLLAPLYAFGPLGVGQRIPGNARVLARIRVLSVRESCGENTEKFDEFLRVAQRRLREANAQMTSGDKVGARFAYDRIKGSLEDRVFADAEEEARTYPVLEKVLSNLALCKLQLGNCVGTLGLCKRVIELNPRNPKAWYRRGKAYFGLGKFELAQRSLNRALKLAPGDKDIVRTLAETADELKRAATAAAAAAAASKKVAPCSKPFMQMIDEMLQVHKENVRLTKSKGSNQSQTEPFELAKGTFCKEEVEYIECACAKLSLQCQLERDGEETKVMLMSPDGKASSTATAPASTPGPQTTTQG